MSMINLGRGCNYPRYVHESTSVGQIQDMIITVLKGSAENYMIYTEDIYRPR